MKNNFILKIYPKASEDIKNIIDYIAVNLCNKTAALKQLDDFEREIKNLCIFPESCPLINNEYINNKNIRKLIVNNYIVFYEIDNINKEIHIIRVLYGMPNCFTASFTPISSESDTASSLNSFEYFIINSHLS